MKLPMKRLGIVAGISAAFAAGLACGIVFEHGVGLGNWIDRAGWRYLVMEYRTRDLGDRRPVPIPKQAGGRTMVALVFGQSNAANSGETLGASYPGVLEFYRGQTYLARDPLLGADGNGGSTWLRLGALAVKSGAYDHVVLVPFAMGATPIRDWAPGGGLHRRLLAIVAEARASGLEFTHLLWHQGEADAMAGTPPGAYADAFRAMVASLRQHGVSAPIYVARATRCGRHHPSEPIREAQSAVVNPSSGVLAGPDTDTLGFGERYDGCHFSTEGLDRAAELWLQSILAATREIKLH